MKQKINKNWENSEYTDLIRIKKSDKEYIKKKKGELSLAGYLHYLIQEHRAKDKL